MVSARRPWAGTALVRWLLTGVLAGLLSGCAAMIEEARAVPEAILAASNCSVAELLAMKNELIGLRDRLNVALGE